jgi:23S rRNA (uracil1939-C5)-methyltransferase
MANASSPDPGPQEGETCELVIGELGYGGVGVARHASGLICLVPRSLPGERVEAIVHRRQRRIAHMRLRRVLAPSPARVTPPCPHFPRCGGCHLQHLSYRDQLDAKREVLLRNLSRALGSTVASLVEPVVASPLPFAYRNRNFFHAAGDCLGFVDPLAQEVIDIDACPLSPPAANASLAAVRAWLGAKAGPLRDAVLDVMLRTGSAESMCVLVLDADRVRPADLEVARVRSDGPLHELRAALTPASVWVNLRSARAKATFGDVFAHVGGPRTIREQVGPFALELSPDSFAQANAPLAAILYERAVRELAPHPAADTLDLYCGSGALSFHLARAARTVYAVEVNHRALADARASAALNRVANVTWRAGKCETIAARLYRDGARFACAALNPPRGGLHESLPAALARLGVERCAYVSCSPPTLARDLRRFLDLGYELTRLVPFDMFAQTYHLEVLAVLQRGGSAATTDIRSGRPRS